MSAASKLVCATRKVIASASFDMIDNIFNLNKIDDDCHRMPGRSSSNSSSGTQ